jgi:peptidoglycan/xylan/chitin deacetylase (PgdA/CDA1 family)
MLSRKKLKIGAVLFALPTLVIMFIVLRQGWIVKILAKRSPEVLYFVETQEPVVSLTIDDGPDPVATPEILDVLKRYGARATFFLITDHIPGNEETLVRVVKEGHEVANHLTTDQPSIRLAPSEFERQLLVAHEALSRYSDVVWFRPGGGWYNTAMLSILHRHGYRCALGSVYPFDAKIGFSGFAARYVLWNIRPGSIIILHDHGARGKRTASALATILAQLNRRGFRVVTLSELADSYPTDE